MNSDAKTAVVTLSSYSVARKAFELDGRGFRPENALILSGQSTFAVSLPRINFGFKSGEYTHHSKGIGSFEWRIVLVSFNGVLPRPLCKS